MTVGLMVANIVVFWYELSLGRQLAPFVERWGLVPATLTAALLGESSNVGALITPLSAMFLHAGWLHLVPNMGYLWFFGRIAEAGLGPARLLLIYLLSGLVAALMHVAATPDSTLAAVGASGAVAGLMGAYPVLRWRRRRTIVTSRESDLLAVVLLLLWLVSLVLGGVVEIAQGGQVSSLISWRGHLGGLVTGLLLVSLYGYVRLELPGAKR